MSAASAAEIRADRDDSCMDELHAHVAMLHRLAAPLAGKGKLIVARFGEHPETGRKCSPLVRHFGIGDVAGMVDAIRQLGAERDRNLYIPLAVMRPDLPRGLKGQGSDVVAVLGVVGDFDDDAAADYEARLPLPPSYVLETSADRFQAAYLFDVAPTVEEAKPVAEALKALARCDHGTADMSHVWRVPGTPNRPTRKKLAEGRSREPQPMRVAQQWDGSLVSLAELHATIEAARNNGGDSWDFGPEPEEVPHGRNGRPNGHDAGAEDFTLFLAGLPENLRRRIVEPTAEGQRSGNINFVVCALLERGASLDLIEALIQAHPHGVGEKHVGRTDLRKEIVRIRGKWAAEQAATPGAIGELNRSHALILIGDRAAVLFETRDTAGEPETRFVGLDAFQSWYGNRFVEVGDPPKRVSWASHRLSHPRRRQLEGVVFALRREVPGFYNLWRGFAVEPDPSGDCSLFLEHLRENVCQGGERLYRWVETWFAEIVQRPEHKSGTSLVVRGKPGTGKTKLGEAIGSLFPRHYVLADTAGQITGRFNAHMAACLLLHADEAFFAGDPASVGRLKSLVTSPVNHIELKGKEPFTVRNHLRLLETSNEDWVVPAGMEEERRFAAGRGGATGTAAAAVA